MAQYSDWEDQGYDRQLKLAEALRAKGLNTTGEMRGRIYVPKNPWVNFAEGAVGGILDQNAQEGQRDLQGRRQAEVTDFMGRRPDTTMDQEVPGTPAVTQEFPGNDAFGGEGSAPVTAEISPSVLPSTKRVMKPYEQVVSETQKWMGDAPAHMGDAPRAAVLAQALAAPEKALERAEAARQREHDAKQKHLDQLENIKIREQERRISAVEAQKEREASELRMKQFIVANRVAPTPPPAQIITTDQGVFERGRDGKLVALQTADGKPLTKTAPGAKKAEDAKKDKETTLIEAISNVDQLLGIDPVTGKETGKGVLDLATGSYIGSGRDFVGKVFGVSTQGSKAGARAAPLADPILKMVPRFEGPQSDADTKSYRQAIGDLANPNLPSEDKKSAARTVRAMMIKRKGQFDIKGEENAPASPGAASPAKIRVYNPATGEFE